MAQAFSRLPLTLTMECISDSFQGTPMPHLSKTIPVFVSSRLLFSALLAFSAWSILALPSQGVAQDETEKQSEDPKTPTRRKVTNFQELQAAFEAQKIKVQAKKESSTILFATRRGSFSGTMVVKWDAKNGVCHFIQSMPMKIPKEDYSRFLVAAAKLNHGFLFPGIGMNVDNGGVYYRLSIPVAPRNYLFDYEIGNYTRFTLNKAAEFLPTLQLVMKNNIEVDKVIATHQNHLRILRETQRNQQAIVGNFKTEFKGSEFELGFEGSGKVTLKRDGAVVVNSNYSFRGNSIRFLDVDGEMAEKEPGIYSVTFELGVIRFKLGSDPSDGRVLLLTSADWKRVVDPEK